MTDMRSISARTGATMAYSVALGIVEKHLQKFAGHHAAESACRMIRREIEQAAQKEKPDAEGN